MKTITTLLVQQFIKKEVNVNGLTLCQKLCCRVASQFHPHIQGQIYARPDCFGFHLVMSTIMQKGKTSFFVFSATKVNYKTQLQFHN